MTSWICRHFIIFISCPWSKKHKASFVGFCHSDFGLDRERAIWERSPMSIYDWVGIWTMMMWIIALTGLCARNIQQVDWLLSLSFSPSHPSYNWDYISFKKIILEFTSFWVAGMSSITHVELTNTILIQGTLGIVVPIDAWVYTQLRYHITVSSISGEFLGLPPPDQK